MAISKLGRILLRAGLVALPLVVAEVATRVFDPEPISFAVPSRDPLLVYELNPAYPEINSRGMRQPELDARKLASSFVVAVVGDSHAYSRASPRWQQTFPARLEHHLAEITGEPVEVLNFGVPGYDMTQELESLTARVLAYRPDLVVLQYCINDEHAPNFLWPSHPRLDRMLHASRFVSASWQKLLYSPFGNEHLLPWIEGNAPDLLLFTPGLVGTVRGHDVDPLHAPHPPRDPAQVPARYRDFLGRPNLERNVHRFGELARRAGAGLVATGFIEPEERALYESSGFQVLSFYDIFAGERLETFGYDPHRTDTHFGIQGSDRIGSGLATFVAARFAVSARRPS
jgi:hypothetical protein